MDTTEQLIQTTKRERDDEEERPAKKIAAGDIVPEEKQSEKELDISNTDAQVAQNPEEKMDDAAALEENVLGEIEIDFVPVEAELKIEGDVAPDGKHFETELDTSSTNAQVVQDAEEKMDDAPAPEENVEEEIEINFVPTEAEPKIDGRPAKKLVAGDDVAPDEKQSETELDTSNTDAQVVQNAQEKIDDAAPKENIEEGIQIAFAPTEVESKMEDVIGTKTGNLDESSNKKVSEAPPKPVEPPANPTGLNDRGRRNKNQPIPRNQREIGNMNKNDPRGMLVSSGRPPRKRIPPSRVCEMGKKIGNLDESSNKKVTETPPKPVQLIIPNPTGHNDRGRMNKNLHNQSKGDKIKKRNDPKVNFEGLGGPPCGMPLPTGSGGGNGGGVKTIYKCLACRREYKLRSSWLCHIRRRHSLKKGMIKSKMRIKGLGELLCDVCNKSFYEKASLNRHQRQFHSQSPFVPIANIKCSICDFKCSIKKDMFQHFECMHGIEIKSEEKQFPSFADFTCWKESVEKETKSSFVKSKGVKNYLNGAKLYSFRCHRSGNYSSKSTGKRHRKAQGSCKINGLCPASINVKLTEDGTCHVNFVVTHIGHQCELGQLRLKPQERELIASKMAQLIPRDAILDEVRSSINNNLERLHLLTTKDLQNIKRSFKLNCGVTRQDDATSVSAWVQAMKDNSNSCLVLHKPKGEEYPGLNADDFVLIIMNDAQCNMLKKYGSDVVCMDSIQDLKSYGFELITILVLDDLRQEFPCAFLITNRTDVTVVSLFLQEICSKTEKIFPEVFMSDMVGAFFNAWCVVMGHPKKRLFCAWHVDKAWRNNLSKIKSKEKKTEIYKLIRAIMEESELEKFMVLLEVGVKNMCEDPDTTEFGNYFKKCYVPCKEMWAYCYGFHMGLNTSLHIERMHKTIKYLHSKNAKRLDKFIHAIMTFVRDKLFARLVILHKEEITLKISELRNRHKKSFTLSNNFVTINDDSWEVVSVAGLKKIYTVKRVVNQCDCKIVCDECKACIHQYTCSCIDSSIKWNMCKHIHLVCRVSNFFQPEEGNNMDTETIEIVKTEAPMNKVEIFTQTLKRPTNTQMSTIDPLLVVNNMVTDTLVTDNTAIPINTVEIHAEMLTNIQPSTIVPSLEIRKQNLFEILQKKLAEEINQIQYEQQIKALENNFAPLHAIMTAVKDDIEQCKNLNTDPSVDPANKPINPQILFSKRKQRK